MSRMARAASKSLLTAGLLTGLAAGAANFPARAAEATGAVPNFARDRSTTWIRDRPTGDDFLPPLSGPGPVMSAKDHLMSRTAAACSRPIGSRTSLIPFCGPGPSKR